MERKDQKYLEVLKAVDEYNRTALQRVERFYFEIRENYQKFEPYADKEAARRFPRAYALEMEDFDFLGDVLGGMGGWIKVISLSPDKVTIKVTSRHDEDMFGTKNQFSRTESLTYPIYKILEAIFDLNARHRALRDFDFVISQDSVSFKIVADYETEYFHLDAIVAYGSDQDFKKYLSDFKKEMLAYVNYLKKLREDRKDDAGQETFLELKAKFEALPQGKVQEWME